MSDGYLTDDAVIELLEQILEQARKDAIKSYQRIVKKFGFCPDTRIELNQVCKTSGIYCVENYNRYYDVLEFIEEDPYGIFGGIQCSPKALITKWIEDYEKQKEKEKKAGKEDNGMYFRKNNRCYYS